ncbi:Lrp/AsnC family transcriptional regulator [Pyxidicoccus parkwayensis]|uniref:Lrp/AsnC family transcriptional regulator n=1 Tax=Pyxidicoccus parkwayensis TaxID=2813578 RepID=UPI0027392951|nr:Lrp/AsnC family transcriptional regulator [Pyxidicoccus parkwaysis]
MPQLDRIDRAILTALQNNARLSNKELAAQVRLAPSSCLMPAGAHRRPAPPPRR